MKKSARKTRTRQENPTTPEPLSLAEMLRGRLHDFVIETGMLSLSVLLEEERTAACGPRYTNDSLLPRPFAARSTLMTAEGARDLLPSCCLKQQLHAQTIVKVGSRVTACFHPVQKALNQPGHGNDATVPLERICMLLNRDPIEVARAPGTP